MRPGMKLKDKQVYSFDEDGVRLGPASRPIGWEEIEGGTVSRDQARFDRMRQELSGPLHEIHTKLAEGAYPSLLEPARALFPRLADRRSNSAYMVAQALMWANLALHQSEDAIEPYLVCASMRQANKELGSLPGRRRLLINTETGLSPELPLVGFDRTRATAALPHVRARLRKLGPTAPPALKLYVAALALAAGDAASADAEPLRSRVAVAARRGNRGSVTGAVSGSARAEERVAVATRAASRCVPSFKPRAYRLLDRHRDLKSARVTRAMGSSICSMSPRRTVTASAALAAAALYAAAIGTRGPARRRCGARRADRAAAILPGD